MDLIRLANKNAVEKEVERWTTGERQALMERPDAGRAPGASSPTTSPNQGAADDIVAHGGVRSTHAKPSSGTDHRRFKLGDMDGPDDYASTWSRC